VRCAAILLALVAIVGPAACGDDDAGPSSGVLTRSGPAPELQVRSAAFADGGTIPVRFTCDGAGAEPPLSWSGEPDRTRAIAVVVHDTDADYDHLIRVADTDTLAWRPPCPPPGDAPHHYVFSVFALDSDAVSGRRGDLARHAVAYGSITGTYARQR
jgi:phosphatidylethanolamine-binding protein (PEBP) family uncharacterized protein